MLFNAKKELKPYCDKTTICNCPWKNYEVLVTEGNYILKRVSIDPGKTIYEHIHPDDDFAFENENQYGKNEICYIIDSKPGVGFNKNVSKEEVREKVKNNTITEILNFYPTKLGDIFFILAGTVHAICEENLICEIQQSSTCTYRLYDYDRIDKFGNPKELHLEKALEVLNYNKYELTQGKVTCKYFEQK